MNLSTLTEKEIYEAIEVMQNGIAIKPNGDEAKNLQVSIDRAFAELDRRTKERAEKKSESQAILAATTNPSLGIPALNETPEKLAADREKQQTNYVQIETSQKQPESKTYTNPNNGIKTVKAPEFVAPEELINVTLEDAKGNEYTRIGTKAQVRALTRKYFSNIHESWMGKERKMKTGFKNLLAYVVAWKEFDGALPVLRDVLPDYDRYNKGGESKEASEAFKVAQELYKKIVEILNQ